MTGKKATLQQAEARAEGLRARRVELTAEVDKWDKALRKRRGHAEKGELLRGLGPQKADPKLPTLQKNVQVVERELGVGAFFQTDSRTCWS